MDPASQVSLSGRPLSGEDKVVVKRPENRFRTRDRVTTPREAPPRRKAG